MAVFVASLVLAGGRDGGVADDDGGNGPNAITGSWSVTVDRGPAGAAQLAAVLHRRWLSDRDRQHGRQPRSCPRAWKYLGDRLYATTIVFFRFDAAGAFVGSQKIKRTLRLARDGKSFTAISISELLDPAGNLIPTPFPLRATEVARRIVVERIPDVP